MERRPCLKEQKKQMEPETGLTRLREYGVPKKDFSLKKAKMESLENSSFLAKAARGKILAFLEVGWGRELWGDWQDALFLLLIRLEHREMGVVGETGMKSQKRTGRRFLHAGEVGLRE